MTRFQTVRSPTTGLTRRTSTFKEWGVIVQDDETSPTELLIFRTEVRARKVCRAIGFQFAPMVHYVERLEIIG
jgi:hypothetical protein